MRDAAKHILFIDGTHASEAMAAMTLRQRLPDALEAPAEVDSCAPLKRLPDRRRMHKPLDHAGKKDWDGIDPVYDEDARQYSAEEEIEGPDEAARRAIVRHSALVTVDGLQLYCFRHRQPYGPGAEKADPQAQDPNHLEYWMRRLGEQLAHGEALDAIVIPAPSDLKDYHALKPLVTRAKADYPDLKIILMQEHDFRAAPPPEWADAVLSRTRIRDAGDIVRQMLDIPELPKRNLLREDADNRANMKKVGDEQYRLYHGDRYKNWRKEVAEKRAEAKRHPGNDGKNSR